MKSRTLILSAAVVVVALAWAVYLFANPSDKPARTYTGLPETTAEATSSAGTSAETSESAEATSADLATVRGMAAAHGGTSASGGTSTGSGDAADADTGDTDSDSGGTDTNTKPVPVGLTLAERQACYWDIVSAEDRAVADAEAAYPLFDENADVAAHMELRTRLMEEYKAELLGKYDVNREQLDAIALEGVSAGWPMPPLEE